MRYAAIALLFMTFAASAAVPPKNCRADIYVGESRAIVRFRECDVAIPANAAVVLTLEKSEYGGSVLSTTAGGFTFALPRDFAWASTQGVLAVLGVGSWPVTLYSDTGNAPAGNASQSNVSQSDAPPVVQTVAFPPLGKQDLISLFVVNEQLIAATSAGSEVRLAEDGTWQAGPPRIGATRSLPLRHLAGAVAVDAGGSIITTDSYAVLDLPPVNAVAPFAFWAVGDAGRVYRYGEKETPLSQMPTGGTTENLYAITPVQNSRDGGRWSTAESP
jgi:hypothetical protein